MGRLRAHVLYSIAALTAIAGLLYPHAVGANPALLIGRVYAPQADVPPPPGPAAPATRVSGEDQPDASSAYQTHALYFVPKDRTDESLDTNGTITRSLDSVRSWFQGQMRRAPRMDRLSTGAYDITFVRGDWDEGSYTDLNSIADELGRRGFNSPIKRYLIYSAIGMGSTCGEGFYAPAPPVDTGRYAASYLDSAWSCGARDFGNGSGSGAGKAETIVAHEWLHNEGMTPLAAPHHCPTSAYHVCTVALWELGIDPEAVDVLFPIVTDRLARKVLDRDHDDYLDHPYPHVWNLRNSQWVE